MSSKDSTISSVSVKSTQKYSSKSVDNFLTYSADGPKSGDIRDPDYDQYFNHYVPVPNTLDSEKNHLISSATLLFILKIESQTYKRGESDFSFVAVT